MNYSFVLFITGMTSGAVSAATNLRALCDERVGSGQYGLEIVDVLDQPDRADEDRVIATPTVLRLSPFPRLRVVGDLTDVERLAIALDLPPSE